jgi:integrase
MAHTLVTAFLDAFGFDGAFSKTSSPRSSHSDLWVIADLRGKGGRIRTVAVPVWVKQGIDAWTTAAGLEKGRLLRSIRKGGRIGEGLSDWAIWSVVEQAAKQIGIERFGAHDLRRTCAKLCRKSGGDLEQIKFLLGHSSIQTTERYLGSEQDIALAVNDVG